MINLNTYKINTYDFTNSFVQNIIDLSSHLLILSFTGNLSENNSILNYIIYSNNTLTLISLFILNNF